MVTRNAAIVPLTDSCRMIVTVPSSMVDRPRDVVLYCVCARNTEVSKVPRASTIEGGTVTIIRQLSDQRYDGRIPSTIAISDHHLTITGTGRTPSTPVAPGGHNAGTIWSVGYAGKYLVYNGNFGNHGGRTYGDNWKYIMWSGFMYMLQSDNCLYLLTRLNSFRT